MNRNDAERLADRLLVVIRSRPGTRFGLEALADELRVRREELSGAIAQLQTWGYTLSLTESDIKLLAAPDSLTATELGWGLDTSFVGRRILAFNQVKSTNDIAIREAEAGGVEGTTVVAEEQTAGRGRLGRVWHSPPGTGVYISILLRPQFLPDRAPGLSLMTALALAQGIKTTESIDVKIKWPNDIILNDRKVAGILTELGADRHRIHYVIVGVGINVNQTDGDFPKGVRTTATSLRMSVGYDVSRVRLVQNFLREFEREYQVYCREFLAPSRAKLLRYSTLIGRTVRLDGGHGMIEGKAVDIDSNGGLVIERNGERVVVSAGDVTVVKG